jgi:hypothetical protein
MSSIFLTTVFLSKSAYLSERFSGFFKNNRSMYCSTTQGVLAFILPISVLTRTQDQHRRQKIRKIPKNYAPISDIATRPLNLRKPKKSPKFSKMNIFSLKKK